MTVPPPYTHPHPDPAHIMRTYRDHILSFKRKQNAQRNPPARRVARGLIKYKALIHEYLAAKRLVIASKRANEYAVVPDVPRATV